MIPIASQMQRDHGLRKRNVLAVGRSLLKRKYKSVGDGMTSIRRVWASKLLDNRKQKELDELLQTNVGDDAADIGTMAVAHTDTHLFPETIAHTREASISSAIKDIVRYVSFYKEKENQYRSY